MIHDDIVQILVQGRAMLRIEKKLDELLRLLKESNAKPGSIQMLQQLNFDKQVCPLCNKRVYYYASSGGAYRSCGCEIKLSTDGKEENENG